MKTPATPEIAVIVLAAGKGTRMKSETPKVLHGIAGTPMLHHVLQAVQALKPAHTLVVTGYGAEQVEASVNGAFKGVRFARQHQPKGTGHAVQACEPALKDFAGRVVIVYGDIMLNSCPHTLPTLLEQAAKNPAGLTLLTATLDNPAGFGRLFKKGGKLISVEEKDADEAQRRIKTVNPCIYALPAPLLWQLLGQLKPANAQHELYLTDIIELAAKAKKPVRAHAVEASRELVGINTREELAAMETAVQIQLRKMHMANGVTLLDPASVYFNLDTRIAPDVTIEPHVIFGPEVTVESGAVIKGFCHLQGAHIGPGALVGPFARLRPGTTVGAEAHIGNFVEIKNSSLGRGSKANHLTYVGDAEVGADVNLGAGTITANYNKKTGKKSKTLIADGVSTGSHTTLVAPVSLGLGAATGAGTVVREDIPAHALAVAKPEMIVKKNYTK
jgi:bifunctional UDP-N-acetylglucosamine pyrophosphorylase/glucosamine-1-phosphate N-acetyltransferase